MKSMLPLKTQAHGDFCFSLIPYYQFAQPVVPELKESKPIRLLGSSATII